MHNGTSKLRPRILVIGGGLAGSEAAWQCAQRGLRVTLAEMRPVRMTPAHRTDRLAELVCSNSLGSRLPDRAAGVLQNELRILGSLLMRAADATAVPAGGALAVDREAFAEDVTREVTNHPLIDLVRSEITDLPDDEITIVASGPLTSDALTERLQAIAGVENLAFYDAMAPIVDAETIDRSICFPASRYGRGEDVEGDYLNCPMTKEEYDRFVSALLSAETIPLRDFEREDQRFFEGCLPIEQLARRGPDALRFGPMRPVGLRDPRTGLRPWAVVQLRRDNAAGTLYNLVGFQTNLKWGEQDRVFRLIPGLEHARFVRYGQMHRNTFICAPRVMDRTLRLRAKKQVLAAGQITGVEGYAGSIATGLLAGINAVRIAVGLPPAAPPPETMLGALCRYLEEANPDTFQPMKANFGLLPPLANPVRGAGQRRRLLAERAIEAMRRFRERVEEELRGRMGGGSA